MQTLTRKRSAEASPEMDTDLLQKKFKCVKCSVRLQDVKLLKMHFWKVHIQQDEIFNHLDVNDKYLIKSTFRKKTPTKFAEKRKKQKRSTAMANVSYCENAPESNSDSEFIAHESSEDETETETETLYEKVKKMTMDQVRWFNLTKEQIDEREVADRYRDITEDHAEFIKKKQLEDGRIVWAKYGKVMWPARIEKIIRSKTNTIQKVAIRYFEMDKQKSCVFRLDPNRIQLFFRPVENHFKNKESVFGNKQKRFHFISAYSDALEEFYSSVQSELPANCATEILGERAYAWDSDSGSSACMRNMYFVNDKMLSKEEVVALAEAPPSDSQVQTNNERKEYSRQLFAVLESEECQNYVIDILKKNIECTRNREYLEGGPAVRKTMRFERPGPLVLEHQTALAKLLGSLQQTHFASKPAHLRNYDYDVLYPEAVIWAIQKHENLALSKAELKYNDGFTQTSEEATKQRCNEILVKLMEEDRLRQEEERRQVEDARRLITATRPLDSDDSDLESVRKQKQLKAPCPTFAGLEISEEEEQQQQQGEQENEPEEGQEEQEVEQGGGQSQESLELMMQMTVNSIVDTIEKEQLSPGLSNSSESLVDLDL